MKKMSAGIVTMTPAAMMSPQSTTAMWKNSLMSMASVFSSSWPISTSAKRKSFQATMNVKIAVAIMAGSARGITACLIRLEQHNAVALARRAGVALAKIINYVSAPLTASTGGRFVLHLLQDVPVRGPDHHLGHLRGGRGRRRRRLLRRRLRKRRAGGGRSLPLHVLAPEDRRRPRPQHR